MENDSHICGRCNITFTSMEDYARHKYTIHQLRFILNRSLLQKPNIYYPTLVNKPHMIYHESDCEKEVVQIEKKRRMTFNKQLVIKGKAKSASTGNQCNLCERCFRTPRALILHRKNAHQVYRCDLCPNSEQCDIVGLDTYDKHMISHTLKYVCKLCNKRYQSKGGLKYHMKLHTTSKTTANGVKQRGKQVVDDDDEEDRQEGIDQHIQQELDKELNQIHEESVEENVNQIDKDLSQQSYVIMCNVCHQFYETTSDLLQHLISVHITLSPHRCHLCSFSCSKRISLASHMLREHDRELSSNIKLDSLEIDFEGNLIFEANTVPQQSATKENEVHRTERIQIITEQEQSCTESTIDNRTDASVENVTDDKQGEINQSKTTAKNIDSERIWVSSTCDESNAIETTKVTFGTHTTEILNQIEEDGSNGEETCDVNEASNRIEESKVDDTTTALSGMETAENSGTSNHQIKEVELVKALDQLTAVQAMGGVQLGTEETLTIFDDSDQMSKVCGKEKNWACTMCQRSFTRKADMKVHTRKHTGVRPYQCSSCKKGFITKDSLQKHSVVHSEERRYKCGECGKLFKRLGHVRTHLLHTHSSDKPRSCLTCHKHFKTKTALDAHIKTHSDSKPYTCQVCNKSFREKGSLVRHSRTHTGDRPFACGVCGRAFSENSALLRHKKAKVPCVLKGHYRTPEQQHPKTHLHT